MLSMLPRSVHVLAWCVAAWLLVPLSSNAPERQPRALATLLGPFAETYANIQWIRFDVALRDGRFERAYAHAHDALELAPQAIGGWYTLGSHLIFDRGSLESESDPANRRRWINAGLELWQRGQREQASAELAFVRGTTYSYVALIAAELEWPGGARAALEQSAAAFDSAARLGDERGTEFARGARAELDVLDQ